LNKRIIFYGLLFLSIGKQNLAVSIVERRGNGCIKTLGNEKGLEDYEIDKDQSCYSKENFQDVVITAK
jgi:hypothetical protein